MGNRFSGHIRHFLGREYSYLKHIANKHNNLRVSLWPSHGIVWISICKHKFATIPEALSFLKEDARSIVEPVVL